MTKEGKSDVRVLGVLLVVLAIACGPFGVQVTQENPACSAEQVSGAGLVCETPQKTQAQPLDLGKLLGASPGDFVPLNTKGYNYRPESEFSPKVPTIPAPPASDDE
jgi:hypothetical protein